MQKLDLQGKKWEIFTSAIYTFAQSGYENVSMRQIADIANRQYTSPPLEGVLAKVESSNPPRASAELLLLVRAGFAAVDECYFYNCSHLRQPGPACLCAAV